jgi:hypothetical protein
VSAVNEMINKLFIVSARRVLAGLGGIGCIG